ncbi:hypothetical protein GCM10009616_05570 [Microlunatus lacustris]
MNEESLSGLIAANRWDEAVQLALEHRTTWVEQQLDYDTVERLEDRATAFFERWLPSLPPLERLQAAEWAGAQYILSIVHLEDARRTGALFFLEAQALAAKALANSMREIGIFADGPDARLHPSVEQRLDGYADQLEAMSFEFVPLEPGN